MNNVKISRRTFLQTTISAFLLQACASQTTLEPIQSTTQNTKPRYKMPIQSTSHNSIRLFASSGFAADSKRIELAVQRLSQAGFAIDNIEAAYRRFQRFAGTDKERVDDLQNIVVGRATMPKILLGLRGGYGANRILPYVDWASLGDMMRDHGTILLGFSDVCAVQLALLAKSGMMSFSGPMLYSEFGKPQIPEYTMRSFVEAMKQDNLTINVNQFNGSGINVEGILWGGNLSVLASLIGTPYFPDIDGGILFLEDVGEQPYRIERMLQQLYLSGSLKKQQAIILGNFRMGKETTDIYDANYDLPTVLSTMRRLTGLPILTDFPFGHITNKSCFPLGAMCKVKTNTDGGYSVSFANYPHLDASKLNLDSLIPQPFWQSETPTVGDDNLPNDNQPYTPIDDENDPLRQLFEQHLNNE